MLCYPTLDQGRLWCCCWQVAHCSVPFLAYWNFRKHCTDRRENIALKNVERTIIFFPAQSLFLVAFGSLGSCKFLGYRQEWVVSGGSQLQFALQFTERTSNCAQHSTHILSSGDVPQGPPSCGSSKRKMQLWGCRECLWPLARAVGQPEVVSLPIGGVQLLRSCAAKWRSCWGRSADLQSIRDDKRLTRSFPWLCSLKSPSC